MITADPSRVDASSSEVLYAEKDSSLVSLPSRAGLPPFGGHPIGFLAYFSEIFHDVKGEKSQVRSPYAVSYAWIVANNCLINIRQNFDGRGIGFRIPQKIRL